MKSDPCVKTTGGGVLHATEPVSQPAAIQPVTSQPSATSRSVTLTPCRHVNRRGHHCRLFSAIPNLDLCPHHVRQLDKQIQRHHDDNASELLGGLTDFSTPDAVNALLGNLLRQLARKRIARLDAIAIAYVSQLLLGSIAALDRRDVLAQRSADDDGLPPRIIFDPPDPIPDTVHFTPSSGRAAADTPNAEGRA